MDAPAPNPGSAGKGGPKPPASLAREDLLVTQNPGSSGGQVLPDPGGRSRGSEFVTLDPSLTPPPRVNPASRGSDYPTLDPSVTPPPGALFESPALVRGMHDRETSAGLSDGSGAGITSVPADTIGGGREGEAAPKIDGYDLTRLLGRGGMGVVYEGVQQATGRRVAVKFMLNAALASEAARKRFEREVEVVAALQHPGIVSIVDSGVRRGRYFYVMEFVDGRPLDAAMPPGRCPVRDALLLMGEVCDAIDYAHQRGVLHRDLKPSNVIVDAGGKPHLLDFGLAKQTDAKPGRPEVNLTMSEPGQLLGTVAYMSPEQADGRHDEASMRTDVYSLGVIAYELVAGALPIRMEGSLWEILGRIAEEEPAPPSSKRRGPDRDIDAVLLKALEKNPAGRYATAGELAADIRRYLAHEPVLARRVGPVGRSWRWVRRNRAISAVAAAAIVTIAVTSAILVNQVLNERDRANENAEQTKAALVQSRENEQTAKANERHAKENFSILEGILRSTSPDSKSHQGEPTVRELLDDATARLNARPPDSDLTEADVRGILGFVYQKFGDYEKATAHLTRTLAIREKHARGDDPALAEALHNLGAALWWAGDYAAAEKHYVRALEMRRRLFPGDNVDVATSMTHLAACRMRLGRWDDARTLYQDALDMRRRLFGAESEEVAQSINNLAKSHMEAGEYDRAEELFRQSQAMIQKLRGDQSIGSAAATQNLGLCLLEKGDAAGARDAFARAVEIRKALFPQGHPLTAGTLVHEAEAELALGNPAAAEPLVREGMDLYKRLKQLKHPDYADALGVLGSVLVVTSRDAEALPLFDEAIAIASGVKPPSLEQLSTLRGELGLALLHTGEKERGLAALAQSYDEIRQLRGERDRRVLAAADRLSKARQ